MIAEQYRNIKPHFAGGKISPLAFRWRCILLDQDTENPPFEPCRYFVVNVFAETKDQVLDCLGEEYPWCDIMKVAQALGVASDEDYLESWLEYYDNTNQTPIKEAPHKKEEKQEMKKPEQISDTTLLNFMCNHRVQVEVHDTVHPHFMASASGDYVYGATPRDALRGLYIVRRKNNDDG